MGQRRFISKAIGVLIAAAVAIGAAAEASSASGTIPPKTWTGTIQSDTIAGSLITAGAFQNNSCQWSGADQLNGVDGLVEDVTGYGGLKATLTWTADESAPNGALFITFYDASCNGILNSQSSQPVPDAPLALTIPTAAKYALVSWQQGLGAEGIHVTLKSPGKKRRRRHHH